MNADHANADHVSAAVLDMRPVPMVFPETGGHLLVARPKASGTVNGYTVEAERKSPHLRSAVCIRLSAPDGRVANLAGPVHADRTTVTGLVGRVLSPAARSLLMRRSTPVTPQYNARVAASIERALTEALTCLSENVHGTAALVRVASAAEDVDPEKVWGYDPLGIDRGEVQVAMVALLIRHGFTPAAARTWFGEPSRARGASQVSAMAAFRDKGWNPQQVDAVQQVEKARARHTGALDATVRASTWAWSAMTWDEAWLALRAGLTASTARRLQRDREWDEQALTTLGGLRHPDPDKALLVDLAR